MVELGREDGLVGGLVVEAEADTGGRSLVEHEVYEEVRARQQSHGKKTRTQACGHTRASGVVVLHTQRRSIIVAA